MLSAALLALLTCAPARAAKSVAARCLPAVGAAAGPQTLEQLRACQDKARAAAIRNARLKGRTLSADQLEALDEQQRSETRRFLASSDEVIDGGAEAAATPDAGASSAHGAATGKLGGATSGDLSRVDGKSAAEVSALQARLQAAAGDGSKGITPAMAADIVSTLTQAQGGVSPDMQTLLDAVSKDGGKLTPDTMKLLQGAGQAAKNEGLDLNVDPSTEKELLTHDFEGDKKYFPAGSGTSGSPGSL